MKKRGRGQGIDVLKPTKHCDRKMIFMFTLQPVTGLHVKKDSRHTLQNTEEEEGRGREGSFCGTEERKCVLSVPHLLHFDPVHRAEAQLWPEHHAAFTLLLARV